MDITINVSKDHLEEVIHVQDISCRKKEKKKERTKKKISLVVLYSRGPRKCYGTIKSWEPTGAISLPPVGGGLFTCTVKFRGLLNTPDCRFPAYRIRIHHVHVKKSLKSLLCNLYSEVHILLKHGGS